MKRKITVTVLLALSALLCSCDSANAADTETSAIVTEVTVSEPADCCGGELPDCCKEDSQSDCCKEREASEADCCKEAEKPDCCKEDSQSDCCKHGKS